jgi:hypothetical protein
MEDAVQRVTRLEEQSKTLFDCAKRLKARQEKHEEDDGRAMDRVFDRLDNMQDAYAGRLPIWATFLFSALFAACGYLVAIIARGN